MATTVRTVVDTARDQCPLFDIQRIPDKLALRALSQLEKALIAEAADINPDQFATSNASSRQAITTNAVHKAGYALPAAIKYLDFWVDYTDDFRRPLLIRPANAKNEQIVGPAAYIQGGRLYPIDPFLEDWNNEDTRTSWDDAEYIEWHYIASPAEYTAFKATTLSDGLLVDANLAIDATPEKFKTTQKAYYLIDGTQYSKAATTALTFTAAHVILASKFGVVLIQIDDDGTVSTKVPYSTQAYDTAAEALLDLPSPDSGNVSLGYIAIANNAGDWTANTDDLTDGSDVTTAAFNDTAVVVANESVEVTIPDHGVGALSDALAAFMAKRLLAAGMIPPVSAQIIIGQANESRAMWMDLVRDYAATEARYVHYTTW